MATQDAHKELFLDMLTKEEKEALLTKKMEDLRKQNQAIQKRYEEVQADKKRAEVKTGNKLPSQKKALVAPKTTPQTEDHDPPQRQRHMQQQQMQQLQMQQQQMQQQQMQQQQQHLQQSSRPATRNRPQLSQGGGRAPKERPKSQDFRSEPAFEYEPIVDMADLDNRHAKRAQSPSKARRNAPREGPPPDPAYNYLADRSRDMQANNNNRQEKPAIQSQDSGGAGGGRGSKDPRRHPRNFGGADFSNVKSQMKAVKEKERDRRSYPPRNRLEMTVNMTGNERIQYEDWKAERHKVDQERLDRQKTSSGEWRRAWDQDKHFKEFEEPHSSGRTEPVKRPVGRIGSGRFDRGDRDDRRAEGLSQSPKAPGLMQVVQSVPENNDRKPPAGRGRGRGRGRARAQQPGGPGEKPPRPRTWSGGDDARTVECSNDMLVVKIDKSRGCDDHSVEVEYGPDEETEKRKSSPPKRKPGRRSPTKQKQQQQQHQQSQFQDAVMPHGKGTQPVPLLASTSSQDSSIYEGRPASLSQSISVGSTDEWEDITGTDSDMYANTTEDEGELYRRSGGRLNPEAPVFLPTSADLQASSAAASSFGLLPREQRRSRPSTSPRVSECSQGTSSCDESNPLSLPNQDHQQTSQEEEQIAVDEKGLGLVVEEGISEDSLKEKETLDAYEDAEQDDEDEDEEFFDPDKDDSSFNTSSEIGSPRDLAICTDDQSDAVQAHSEQEEEGSSPQDSGASLADELCAAGEPQHSSKSHPTLASVQEDLPSPELNEIEEDDMEEDIVPPVVDDTVHQGEALPDMATASENTEEKEAASVDAGSSCQAAPDDSANGSPRDSDTQMATTAEDDGSKGELEGSSSAQLISSPCKAGLESAEKNVMEQPDIQHVNGLAADDAADREPDDSVAAGSKSSTSLSA